MNTRATAEVIAGTAILGALLFAGLEFRDESKVIKFLKAKVDDYKQVSPTGDPPVKIVGGSMTFRSIQAWTQVTGGYFTQADPQPSVITVERVAIAGTIGSETISNITEPWRIEVDARSADPTKPSMNGVKVCVNSTCNLDSVESKRIYIIPFNKSGDTVGFYDQSLDQANYKGKRYMDATAGCMPKGFCEHIYQIKIDFQGGYSVTYPCPDGECRVYILPPS